MIPVTVPGSEPDLCRSSYGLIDKMGKASCRGESTDITLWQLYPTTHDVLLPSKDVSSHVTEDLITSPEDPHKTDEFLGAFQDCQHAQLDDSWYLEGLYRTACAFNGIPVSSTLANFA